MANRKTATHTKGAIAGEGGVMFGDGVWLITNAGAPTDGASGTGQGFAGKGSLLVDVTNANLYQQTGTAASPVWVQNTD